MVQLPLKVYVSVAKPAATPFTIPVLPTVAIRLSLLVQTPPDGVAPTPTIEPWHTCDDPVREPVDEVTVTVVVTVLVAHAFPIV